jgi:hypothetical protein
MPPSAALDRREEPAMKTATSTLPRARIPYGTWGSSYFPAWQTSALAEVNLGQFAGEVTTPMLASASSLSNALDSYSRISV